MLKEDNLGELYSSTSATKMPLDQGVYRLRYCPDGKPPGLGGVIAVGQDLDAPVRALPDIPEITGLKEVRPFPYSRFSLLIQICLVEGFPCL